VSKWLTEERAGNDLVDPPLPGTWWNPPLGELYAQIYVDRAAQIAGFYPALARNPANPGAGALVAVVGCGYGYLVRELRLLGFNAWGMDGAWAITQARTRLPAYAPFLFLGDVTVGNDCTNFRSAAGLRGGRRFDLGVTEDLYSAADDGANALAMLQGMNSLTATHCDYITCFDLTDPLANVVVADGYYQPRSSWRGTLGAVASHRIIDLNSGGIIVPDRA